MANGYKFFPHRTYLQSLKNHYDCLEETINNLILLLKSITKEHNQHQLFDEIEKLDEIASGIAQIIDDVQVNIQKKEIIKSNEIETIDVTPKMEK